METKILLVGRATDDTNNLRRELKRQDDYTVEMATTPDLAIENIQSNQVDLLVFNTEILTRKKLEMTSDLKEIGQNFPVLVLANSIMADTLGDLESTKGTVFLEKPFEIKDLFGITDKMITGEDVRQRIFRRFQTNQEGAFAKPPAMDVQLSIRIRNLSQGGAYFEYEGRPHINIGDQIYLEIPLQQVKRDYKMKARVVWVTPTSALGRNGLGVEFMR